MKIGIDARMYGAESTTGIGVYINKLTDELFAIDKNNEYYLFLNEPAFSRFIPPSDRIKKVMAGCPWYSYSEQTRLPKILKAYNLDLVHFPHFNVPILYRDKYVITIHDITPKFFPGPRVKKSPFRKLAYNSVFTNAVKKAGQIIAISQHTKNNLIKHFKATPEKIEVIYPGVDEKFKPADKEASFQTISKKYGVDKPFIFYIGVWRDHKNLPGLIKAFDILKTKNQNLQLVLAGRPDPRYPEIEKAITDSRFNADIIKPGFIDQKDLPIFYNAAKMFVLPSFAEGFGLVAVEAAACGTPVAASKTTSLPEVMGDSAVYFDPKNHLEIAEKIDQTLNNNGLYQKLSKLGPILAKKYSWRNCSEKTLAIYKKMIIRISPGQK